MRSASFGVNFLPGTPDRVTAWCRLAEDLGYARVGIGDSPGLYRDPWITLALVAKATKEIPLGIWVTNPITRHPIITANAAASLSELSPGRVCIGIATGDTGIRSAGFSPSTLESLAAYVHAVRELLEVGHTRYEGRQVQLSWPAASLGIPIYVAAHGRASIYLAGEIADGVVIGLGIEPGVIDQSLDWLQQGAARRGRVVDDIDVWWTVRYLVSEEEGAAREEMAGILAENAHVFARSTLKGRLGTGDYRAGIEQLASEYDLADYGTSEMLVRRKFARRASELGVADYLVDRYSFAGTPEECSAQVSRAVEAGARQFMYSMRGPDRERRLRDWHRLVLARLPKPESS